MLGDAAQHVSAMSSQHDDDGTVIRPVPLAPAIQPAVTSPDPGAEASSAAPDDGLSLHIGTHLAEFEITQRIGEGGFSIVYLAKDHSLERTVALKEYMPSSLATRVGSTQVQPRSQRYRDTFQAGLKSFVNEAKLLAQFDHPSLVKVYRFWEANGTAYMVMPFYRGVTVKDAIRAMPEPPDEAWLLDLLAPLTEALMVIHAEHCYHRDIAPDNVILLAGSAKPLLLDFGAARRVIGDMTQGLTVILKAGYAPVEQYAEVPGMKQGAWTDVYALAAVVYWAITGSTPPASVARMMSDSCVPLAVCAAGRYSRDFLEAIDRALVVQPERRTQSIADLRRELGLSSEADEPPIEWGDPDATVIRPATNRTGQRTHTQPRSVARSAPKSGGSGLTYPPSTIRPTRPPHQPDEERIAEERIAPPVAEAHAVPAEQDSTKPRGRWMTLAAVAVGTVVLASGVWWVVQKPGSEPPGGVTQLPAATTPEPATPGSARAVPSDAAPPTVRTPPAVEPPVQRTPPPTQTTPSVPADSPPSPTLPSAPDPTAGARPSHAGPVERTPDRPSIDTARQAPPADSRPLPRGRSGDRPAARPDAAAERAQPDAANRAECVRIMQRLSLGESSPELINRLKVLNCR